jgi:hypothetical protein
VDSTAITASQTADGNQTLMIRLAEEVNSSHFSNRRAQTKAMSASNVFPLHRAEDDPENLSLDGALMTRSRRPRVPQKQTLRFTETSAFLYGHKHLQQVP